MVTVYDVPAEKLILRLSEKLKENDKIVAPDWAEFAKTGIQAERAPVQGDWWYTRAASVMRKLYVKGPMGTSKLAGEYGGYVDRGSKPNRAVKGSRNIIRKILIQLQDAGLLEATKDLQGRKVSPAGQKLLDSVAKEVFDEAKN
ncbi:MAG: 30S ribosomal protein S19e [Methanomethylophilus sp.]|nr:30S ribosomal protein S19e [Methanomethylophilus sp.]TQS78953.1 MAG: 30S ribosomal protein S19 [Methanomethylophilus alvi]WII09417.1 30S ribosomal protein S19e [Methanomassiliicoccales archaeon LGM-DZ1]